LDILSIISSIGWIEWLAFILGILYVFFAALEKPICWVFGGFSCALWAYATFVYYELWVDALLQLFYVGMAIWGWIRWKNISRANQTNIIVSKSLLFHVRWILTGIVVAILTGYFFDANTPAAATYLDSFNTIFSIIATYLVVKKVLENWIYWIIIDLSYVYLYVSREAWSFAILLTIYTIVAIFGWKNWKKLKGDQIVVD
jgi:nicotinamide mononucleotide transporter